ncbi:MAG: hypothetical protein ACYDH5_05535 [Acidimicrobiales bacterium]
MATGVAGQLAGASGVARAGRPLLWLALAEGLWITGRGIVSHHRHFRCQLRLWWRIGRPGEHTGMLTVPLGLAVLATGIGVHAR